ncbi:TPA: hypothetical protein EYP38_00490 [Candidatus Micrarchaeota archaeon]|nr:hypothetical protein [Candidatus Micrarchaeota archaeon]
MNGIDSISDDLDEPKWLKEERRKALALLKEEPKVEIPALKKPEIRKSKNVRMLTLAGMLEKDSKFAKKAFISRRISPDTSAYSAYLGAYFRDCSFIFVDKGKRAELDLSLGGSLSMNFIFIGDNASLRISGSAVSNCLDICEMQAGENARIDCAFLKQKGAFAYRGLSASMGTGSSLCAASFWSGSGHGDTAVIPGINS